MAAFFYDLVRTTRRGRPAALRAGYALVLLVALGGVFVRWFPGSLAPARLFAPSELTPKQAAAFALDFATAFLCVQLGAAVLLTPAAAAGAVAEERQRGTLDFLLVSHLSSGAIVLGKFAARWLHLMGLLLTGLPVLALTLLWGSADWRFLTFGFALTALTSLSLAALSLLCSVTARSVRGAVAATYALAVVIFISTHSIPFLHLANPHHALSHFIFDTFKPRDGVAGSSWLPIILAYGAWQTVIGFVSLAIATHVLRPVSPADRTSLPHTHNRRHVAAVRVAHRHPYLQPGPSRARVLPVPPIGDQPLLWKELYFGGSAGAGELLRVVGYALVGLVLTVGLTTGVARLGSLGVRTEVIDEPNPFARSATVTVLTVVTVGTAVRSAAAVSRERERRTLDSLLALPGGRDAVLRAKWVGGALWGRWFALALAAVWVVSVLAGGLHPAAVVWLTLAGVVHAAFQAGLGLCLSVVARDTERATYAVMAVLVASWVLPLVGANYWVGLAGPAAARLPWLTALLEEGLVPPLTWRHLCLADSDKRFVEPSDERLVGVLLGLAGYALAGWLLWQLARRLFRREVYGDRRP
jgi:ABC-type transport system involved in multi-copper enzyme maturation permease subunit